MKTNNMYDRINSIGIVLITLLIASTGCTQHTKYNELIENIPEKLSTYEYSMVEISSDMSILSSMRLVENSPESDKKYYLFLDTTDSFENGASFISVLNYPCRDTILKNEWEEIVSNRLRNISFTKYSEGLTSFLGKEAYYEHSSELINNYQSETINFLFRSNKDLTMFLITLQVNSNENYPENLNELLYCVKTFDE